MLSLLKRVAIDHIKVSLGKTEGKKITKSFGLSAVGVLITAWAASQPWFPEAWETTENIALITGGVTFSINFLRKLIIKQV